MLDSGSTMETIQLIIGIIVLIGVGIIIFQIIYGYKRRSGLTKEELRFDGIRSVYKKLKANKVPERKLIMKYANSLEKRILLFEALEKFNRTELFPKELNKQEKLSESYLSNWLNMNDIYDSFPDEIEFCENHEYENGLTIFVYQFKNYEPHLFAQHGWMYGYLGYRKSSKNICIEPDFIECDFSKVMLNRDDLGIKMKYNNNGIQQHI